MRDVGTEESRVGGETKELEAASRIVTGDTNCETGEQATEGGLSDVDTVTEDPEVVVGAAGIVVAELSGGVNAGSGFVTCEGEAPALRVDGGFRVPSPSRRAGAAATGSPGVKESL